MSKNGVEKFGVSKNWGVEVSIFDIQNWFDIKPFSTCSVCSVGSVVLFYGAKFLDNTLRECIGKA